MAVALTPAITAIPTASPSSSADLRVTSAVSGEPKSIVVRTNGPKGTIFMIVPLSWLRTLVLGRSPSLTAMVTSSGRMIQDTFVPGFTGSDHFKDSIPDTIRGHAPLHWIRRPLPISFQYPQTGRCLCHSDGKKCHGVNRPGQFSLS